MKQNPLIFFLNIEQPFIMDELNIRAFEYFQEALTICSQYSKESQEKSSWVFG